MIVKGLLNKNKRESMISKNEHGKLADHFRYASQYLFQDHELYSRLCTRISRDNNLLDLARETTRDEPPAYLLLASINYVANNAGWSEWAVEASLNLDSDIWYRRLKAFCIANEDSIRNCVRERRVQTNEVGRSSYYAIGAALIAKDSGSEAMDFVDMGCSAGLNLFWDNYNISILSKRENRDDGGWTRNRDCKLRLRCSVHNACGYDDALDGIPQLAVRNRIGIELSPIDRDSENDLKWLRSLVWPMQEERLIRLHKALSDIENKAFRLVSGNAPEVLQDSCRELDGRLPIVVAHSYLMDKMTTQESKTLKEKYKALSQEYPIYEIGISFGMSRSEWYVLKWQNGEEEQLLASGYCHPHGKELYIQ